MHGRRRLGRILRLNSKIMGICTGSTGGASTSNWDVAVMRRRRDAAWTHSHCVRPLPWTEHLCV